MSEKVLAKETVLKLAVFFADWLQHRPSAYALTESHEALRAERDAALAELVLYRKFIDLTIHPSCLGNSENRLALAATVLRRCDPNATVHGADPELASERDRVQAVRDKNWPEQRLAIQQRDAALAEVERLRAELADIKASYRATVEEPCDAGQVHCTCVPALRAEVESLRGPMHNVTFERDVLKSEVERLRAEVDSLRTKHDAKVDRINALEAEVERMRPVVEAAMKEADEAGDWHATLWCAVDAFRASAQKEGKP